MSKKIDIGVEKDHVESLTKANGITALSELIWNGLDADSNEIRITFNRTRLGGFESIIVKDNGHGLTYEKAQDVFSRLGGSEKKIRTQSPGGRHFHGKEGKGRYKSLSLGDLVTFKSTYQENGKFYRFNAVLDQNNLSFTELGDLEEVQNDQRTGFEVEIDNVNDKNAVFSVKSENRIELEEKFASYWISYPDFKIFIDGEELAFSSLIKSTEEKEVQIDLSEDLSYNFTIKILEWTFDNKKKTYLCSNKGIPYSETNLGIRSSLPISIFIQSVYIEKLHRENSLDLGTFDEVLNSVFKIAKDFARDYVRKRLHFYSREFIAELKQKGIYPYKLPSENIIEETKRQVFDIVALQINEHLPSFNEQDDRSKKLTLSLVSEALENDASNLKRILTEVIELPQDKRDDLADLLESTTLSCIIDTMTEIKNRLNFLIGLEQIIYEKEYNQVFKERKHLHKIVVKETWIFGDEYTYGVDDVTLKNVLKAYLKDALKRDDFEEVLNSDNSELQTIPDVCLWQQYSMGSSGKENLVIELKKPIIDAGWDEKTQIESYASKVAQDPRFPKDKTRWKFILVTKNIKNELIPTLNQKNRKYGHIQEGDNFDVYIMSWGDIITQAKVRHEFIKEKLNLNLQENEEGLTYLKNKYSEYMPQEILDIPAQI